MTLPNLRALAFALVLTPMTALPLMAQDEPAQETPELETQDLETQDLLDEFIDEQVEQLIEEAEAQNEPRDPLEVYADLNLFGDIFDRIRREYVDVPDERELIRAAIHGMLTSLDPHSGYLSPESYEEVREDNSGQFGGLGIEVTMEDGVVKVVAPIDDTPAHRAGILANDLIVELDGEQVFGMSLDDALDRMRGVVGTGITLTVVREGVSEPLEFDIVRDVISQRAVRWDLDREVGVMRLSRFTAQAYSGIESAIEGMIAELDGELPRGLVLDMRNNPGGLVDQAVYVADAFLSRGAVVLTRGRTERESARFDAQPDDLDALLADVPLVVLINGGSASAAEIVAGALQDHRRATVVGTRSFGKGSVQSIISLGPNGAMRLTTSRYYTPNNRSIQALGIVPDIEIRQTVPEEFQGRDEILGEAGLRGHIEGEDEGDEPPAGSSVWVPADREDDDQMNYAIDLILGEASHEAFPPNPDI